MKLVTTTLCTAAVMVWTIALGAQNTTTPSTQTQQPRGGTQTTAPQARNSNTTTVSYIGCVESSGPNAFALTVSELPGSATATAGTTTGTTQGRPDATISGNARVGDTQVGVTGEAQVNRGQGRDTTTATGTTGATTSSNVVVGSRMQLIGSARSNIGTHVGHKVEVTGTMVPQGAAQGRTTGQPAAEMRLNVSNVRMISAMCDSGASNQQTRPRSAAPDSTTQPSGRTPGAAGTSGTTTPTPDTGQQSAPEEPAPAPAQQPQQQRQ